MDAHDIFAFVLFEEGKFQEALNHCDEAIRLNPYYAYAYNSRGNAFAKIGNHQQAIEDYNKVIRMEPDYANSYYNRGILYLNQGNTNDGCRDTYKACNLGMCKVLEEAKIKGLCR